MTSIYNHEAFMRHAPRFGHSRDISLLAGSTDRKKEYIYGIVAFSLFLISLFLLWSIFTLVFKWRGRGKYGCVAGRFFYKPEKQDRRRISFQIQSVQSIFMLFSLGIFAGSIILVKKAMPNLGEAADSIQEVLQYLFSFLKEGLAVASDADNLISSLHSTRLATYSNLQQYCSSSTIDIAEMSSRISTIKSALDEFDTFIEEYKLDQLKENINIIQTTALSADRVAEMYVNFYWVPKMYTIIVCLTTIFILVLAVVSMLKKRYKGCMAMLSYFLIPIFTALVAIGWVCMVLFGAAAIMNADFCYGDGANGPVSTIENVLVEYGLDSTHILNKSFQYYKSTCTLGNPWEEFLLPFESLIKGGIRDAEFFLAIDTTDCGAQFTDVVQEVSLVKDCLTTFLNLFDQTLQLTECGRVIPFFTMMFDGESCSSSLIGLSWTFCGLLTLAIFGLLMISFRAALYDVKVISMVRAYPPYATHHEVDWDDFDHMRRSFDGITILNKTSHETRNTEPSVNSFENDMEVQKLSPLSQISSQSNSTLSTHDDFQNVMSNDVYLKPTFLGYRKG